MKSLEKYHHARNYGCRIKEVVYEGLKTVHLENNLINVGVLADKGADIYEFLYKPKDIDVMWHSFNGVKDPRAIVVSKEHPGGGFLDCYEGGWQELFPSISSPCEYQGATLGIHGEVAMPGWNYKIIKNEIDEISVLFWIRTMRMPFLLERKMTIKNNDATLYLDEQVTNESNQKLDFMWGHHPAYGPIFLDDSCEILIDSGSISNISFDWQGKKLSKADAAWPWLTLNSGEKLDVSKVKGPDEQLYMEFAVSNFKHAGYEIKNYRNNIGFGMEWDQRIFPHIWMWAVYGGGLSYPWFGRAYTLALEPWSSIPGDLNMAVKNKETIKIQAGQKISTQINAFFKSYD
jgi:galactose mutarotase-like enzyme